MLDWLIAGGLIIAGLAAYAIRLQQQLKKRDRDNAQRVEALVAEQAERKATALQSIEVIARAMQDEQCAFSEGCIRLSALLTQVDPQNQNNPQYSAFFQVAEALAHIPIMEQWQALPKKEQNAFLLEINEIESKYKEFVEVGVGELLKDFSPEQTDNAVKYFG